MDGGFAWNDRYAGDRAWTEWFEICSVAGCSAAAAAALRSEIESAMYSRLVKCGFSVDDAAGDDPVAFFDSYFRLKGSRESPKPLKSYFRYRIRAEGLRLRDFVCGTLFGAASGRIRDIVTDWISACKGWKPRTVRGEDGKRRLAWENAREDDSAALDLVDDSDPAGFLDEGPVRAEVEAALEAVARKTGVEKQKIALLLFVTAQDVSLTEPAVLSALGTGKSRAYQLRDKAMKEIEREMRGREGADDPLFGRILLETCEANLGSAAQSLLGGAR